MIFLIRLDTVSDGSAVESMVLKCFGRRTPYREFLHRKRLELLLVQQTVTCQCFQQVIRQTAICGMIFQSQTKFK